ncbi:hypothetical protein CASFOL_022189 [Castilleja foliolosa]|uniref:Uncharacterized protein n=1 Tax=Castilleja foliolosa TaxID=1961234 RepID=A0ABD3CVC5_9LAMI
MADMHKTNNPTGAASGFQRRNMPYSPYAMAAAGLAAVGGMWYFYNRRKADHQARPQDTIIIKTALLFNTCFYV